MIRDDACGTTNRNERELAGCRAPALRALDHVRPISAQARRL
jgi:hypothetical protein